MAASSSACLAGRGEVDVVATRAQVDRQRAQQICGSSSTTSTRVMRVTDALVRPPGSVDDHRQCRHRACPRPSSSPPIASTKPRATARPSPTPLPFGLSPEPLERLEHALALVRRDARAPVDDAQLDPVASTAPATTRTGVAGRTACEAFVDEVRDRPLEQRGVGADRRQRLGHVDVDVARAGRGRPGSAAGTISSSPTVADARAPRARSASRLMSSRLPTSVLSRSASSSIASSSSARSRRRSTRRRAGAGSSPRP